jgi:alpha-beta hydrolase superfamily lysophospholipase
MVGGWFVRGRPGAGGVLLLHGVRHDRRQMTGRARWLHERGHSVLLIDLPAHGESGGDRITFGAREADGARAALRFLEEALPGEPLAAIGVSLGAAALVLGGIDGAANLRALVLESMYPTIDEAIANRLRLHVGAAGAWLAPLLAWQLPLRLSVPASALQPLHRMSEVRVPVVIDSGGDDRHTGAGGAAARAAGALRAVPC